MSMLGKSCALIFAIILVVLIGGIWIGFKTRSIVELSTARLIYSYGTADNFSLTSYRFNETEKFIENPNFNITGNTVLLVHGYNDHINGTDISLLMKTYLATNAFNVLMLDWAELAKGNLFFDVIPNLNKISKLTGKLLDDLFNAGINNKHFHIVAVGVGVPLAGVAGRTVQELTGHSKSVGRITGLDPAFFPFVFTIIFSQLCASDAEFVDVIHTDAWRYGTPSSIGTADFWPNGGESFQPGCTRDRGDYGSANDTCSHDRAVRFYVESVTRYDDYSFHALKCSSWGNFRANNKCDINDIVSMGIACDVKTARGDYFLQTSGMPPFSKDMDGAYFFKKIF